MGVASGMGMRAPDRSRRSIWAPLMSITLLSFIAITSVLMRAPEHIRPHPAAPLVHYHSLLHVEPRGKCLTFSIGAHAVQHGVVVRELPWRATIERNSNNCESNAHAILRTAKGRLRPAVTVYPLPRDLM